MYKISKYDSSLDSKKDLEKISANAYKQASDFFKKEVNLEIIFLYSRKELDDYVGKQTKEWNVGLSRDNKVIIFSPSVFGKISDHPQSDFYPVLVHEMAHVYTREIYGFIFPRWLVEGLSGHIAGQYKIRPVRKVLKLKSIHEYDGWWKNTKYAYAEAYSFTNYLIMESGKDKFINLLEKLGTEDNYDEFSSKFSRVYRKSVEEYFKNWKDTLGKRNR